MSRVPIRVVKVGGSLFDLPDLAARLHAWLANQEPAHQILVAGGGMLVQGVRDWHKLHPLSNVAAHWICIDLMSISSRLLHESLPEIPLFADDRILCQRIGEQACTIFDPSQWLRYSEPKLPGTTLPASWNVTSDSIAARLAIVLAAEELVLMKSTLPELHYEIKQLVEIGYVDPMLADLASELPPLRFVDLRSCSRLIMGGTQNQAEQNQPQGDR